MLQFNLEIDNYNNNERFVEYKNKDIILNLNLPKEINKNIEEKFNKKIFFDYNGSCKIGNLIGIKIDKKLSKYFYIIELNNKEIYISCFKSLTLVQ
jgi:hypothetical protein